MKTTNLVGFDFFHWRVFFIAVLVLVALCVVTVVIDLDHITCVALISLVS